MSHKTDQEIPVGTEEMAELMGWKVPYLLKRRRQGLVPGEKSGPKTIKWYPTEVKRAAKMLDDNKTKSKRSGGPKTRVPTQSVSLPKADWSKKRVHSKLVQEQEE